MAWLPLWEMEEEGNILNFLFMGRKSSCIFRINEKLAPNSKKKKKKERKNPIMNEHCTLWKAISLQCQRELIINLQKMLTRETNTLNYSQNGRLSWHFSPMLFSPSVPSMQHRFNNFGIEWKRSCALCCIDSNMFTLFTILRNAQPSSGRLKWRKMLNHMVGCFLCNISCLCNKFQKLSHEEERGHVKLE